MGLFFILGPNSSASHIHETKASNYMHPGKGQQGKKKSSHHEHNMHNVFMRKSLPQTMKLIIKN